MVGDDGGGRAPVRGRHRAPRSQPGDRERQCHPGLVCRADIRSVEVLGDDHVAVGFEDYSRAIHRVIGIELRRRGDRNGFLAQLTAGPGDQEPVT